MSWLILNKHNNKGYDDTYPLQYYWYLACCQAAVMSKVQRVLRRLAFPGSHSISWNKRLQDTCTVQGSKLPFGTLKSSSSIPC